MPARKHIGLMAGLSAVLAALVLIMPGAARAAPPILGSVSFNNATRVLSVSWSLPPGVESRVLEAATDPATDSDGYFLHGAMNGVYDNTIFEVPDSSSTSWVHAYPYSDLAPGTYYLHVGGYDSTCLPCAVREWTSIATFTVAAPPPPAKPALQSVSFDNATRVLSVSWSLPPGVESRVLEAATDPATDSEGYFLHGPNNGVYGSNVIFESTGISDTTTSWVHAYPDLPDGTYYVHVAGFDPNCYACAVRQWSNIATFKASAMIRPVIGKPTTSPGRAIAGKRFTVTFRVSRSDNGGALTSGKMTLNPLFAGRVIRHSETFASGRAKAVFTVPKKAKGKSLTVRVSIKNGTQSSTRTARFSVRR